MTPLKPQTVYIPIDKDNLMVLHPVSFIDGNKTIWAAPYQNKIILSKEQLIELLTDAFNTGYDGGWCMAKENTDNDDTIYSAEEFVNQTLTHQKNNS